MERQRVFVTSDDDSGRVDHPPLYKSFKTTIADQSAGRISPIAAPAQGGSATPYLAD